MAKQSAYQMYPIYDYTTGLNLSKEPWLTPAKAFVEILNFHVREGVLSKRKGRENYGEMVHAYDESVATGDGATTTFTHTASNTPIRSDESQSYLAVYVDTSGGQVLHDEDGDGNLSGDGSGTIDYATGEIEVTFAAAPADGAAIKLRYNHLAGEPILGLFNYYSGTGDQQLLAFDLHRINAWFPTQEKFQDTEKTDIFTTNEWNDFVWFETWSGSAYFTNGKEPVKKYDGSSLSELPTDIDGNGTNDIDTTHLIFAYKGHLVFLRPTEYGTLHPQRARFSAAGFDNDWENGGFVDAPTLDWIIGAGFVGDQLIVLFERSIWALNYVGDVDLPFAWEKIVSTEGTAAPLSIVPFAQELLFLGPVNFLSTDTVNIDPIDRAIPDYSLRFNQEYYSDVYGAVLEEEHEVFWNFTPMQNTRPTHNLVYNYRNSAWSIFDIPGPIIGYARAAASYTWDTTDLTWNELNFTWDAKELQVGYPTTLTGKQDGTIDVINRSTSDNGADIECRLRTKPFNPFRENGKAARLGYVDLYYTIDPESVITLSLFDEENGEAYYTVDITLDGPSNRQKAMKRIAVHAVAPGHSLQIYQSAQAVDVDIHAFVFWFKPAGNLTEAFI